MNKCILCGLDEERHTVLLIDSEAFNDRQVSSLWGTCEKLCPDVSLDSVNTFTWDLPDGVVNCPKDEPTPNSLVGCGSTNIIGPDNDGLYDCLDCGLWFSIDARRCRGF